MIGVLTTSYPRFAGDAAGSFVQARVRLLRAAGAEVEVLAAGDHAGDGASDDAGAHVVRVPYAVAGAPPLFYAAGAPEALEADAPSAALGGARFFAGLTAAARARAHRWERVESHWLVPAALVATQVAARLPHRAHAHSGDVALLERLPGGATLARLLCASGAELVFASADLRHRFARLAGPAAAASARTLVAPATSLLPPPRLRDDERAGLCRTLGLAGWVVLGVGRLVPIKGYDVLVRAVARLRGPERPVVVLVGDGPERAALAALAASRHVDLRLVGQVAHTEVARYLATSDVFVHPCRRLRNGRTEGQPVAVSEALAARLPVIAAATGGLLELAARSPAVELVPPDDPAALAGALVRAARRFAAAQGITHSPTERCVAEEP